MARSEFKDRKINLVERIAEDVGLCHAETKEKQKTERNRKEYAKKGERSQKMMCFRLDNDLESLLSTVKNKGRLINDLLHKYFETPPNTQDPEGHQEHERDNNQGTKKNQLRRHQQ